MTTLINHWINGQIVATSAERTGAVYDPATGQQAAQVAYATGEDVDAAVRAAQAACPAWRDNGRGRDRGAGAVPAQVIGSPPVRIHAMPAPALLDHSSAVSLTSGMPGHSLPVASCASDRRILGGLSGPLRLSLR
jgi:hypothetical protein